MFTIFIAWVRSIARSLVALHRANLRRFGTRRFFLLGIVLSAAGCSKTPPAATPIQNTVAAETHSTIFEDVYPATGIDFAVSKPDKPLNILETIGHGGAIMDVDGDGIPDVLLVGPDRVALYKNLGDFRFQDITNGSGLRQKGYWCGVAVGDYDNDGKPDIFLCGYDCSALYHNEGGGHFREVTESAGVGVRPDGEGGYPEWRTVAGFVDFDRDGKLDLYVCRYAQFGPRSVQLCGPINGEHFSCSPDIYTPQIGILYRNLGSGKFQDVTKAMGLDTASGRGLGVAFADYNDDGWPDIAITNDERPGDLFTNQKGKRFVNDGVVSGTAVSVNGHVHGGMGADWADFDGDGKLDLFVATYQNEAKCLYKNMGHDVFSEASLDAGLSERMDRWVTFGCKFIDYDNDGQPDLMVTNGHIINNTAKVYAGTQYRQPVQLFHNENGQYREVTDQLGSGAKRLLAGRGLLVGDLDNDGKPDVIVTQNEGAPLILKNQTRNANHWIGIKLVGTGRTNRDGRGGAC